MLTALEQVNRFLWSILMPILFGGVGLVLTFRLRFFQLRGMGLSLKHTFGALVSFKKKGRGNASLAAVSTALAGTVGTGSITGLASAMALGGAGVLFWMWIASFFGMILKYAEILLAHRFRKILPSGAFAGGPMYYLQRLPLGSVLSVLFSVFCILATFGIGNTVQANAIASALQAQVGLSPVICGIALSLLCGIVCLGGIRRIGKVNETLVPVMTLLYVVACLCALLPRFNRLPALFSLILRSAFRPTAALAGLGGYGLLRVMTLGLSRGVFASEAGLGSAAMAHGTSREADSAREGLWGIFEVFFTTVVMATLTGLVLLEADLWSTGLNATALSIASFEALLPRFGGLTVIFSTVLFALSSLFGWAYYGESAVTYLGGKEGSAVLCYRVFYLVAVFFGAVCAMESVWTLSELANALMAIPNLLALLFLSRKTVELTKTEFPEKFR
ncbi:MAG: sodium:alanine symporter family protein [Clostridia bacterium]|nr:sodium:alanine symporter family protein [Clostridia bacterium]